MKNETTFEQYNQLKQKMESIQYEKSAMDKKFCSQIPEYIDLLVEYKKALGIKGRTIYLDSIDEETEVPEKFDKMRNKIEIIKYKENSIDFRISYYMGCNEWSWEVYKAPLAFFFDDEYKQSFYKEIEDQKEKKRLKEQKENEIDQKMQKERSYQEYLALKAQFEGEAKLEPGEVLPKEKIKAAIHQFKSTARMLKLQKESDEHYSVQQLRFEHFLFLHFLKGTDYTKTVPSQDSESLKEAISSLRASCYVYNTRIKNTTKTLSNISDIKRIQNVFTTLTADEIVAVIKNAIGN